MLDRERHRVHRERVARRVALGEAIERDRGHLAFLVVPAQAGTQCGLSWIPAFAGMTVRAKRSAFALHGHFTAPAVIPWISFSEKNA